MTEHKAAPKPSEGEIRAARAQPNGWIYRIDKAFDPNGEIPPHAVIGAWKVGPDGVITGAFTPNPNYRASTDGATEMTAQTAPT